MSTQMRNAAAVPRGKSLGFDTAKIAKDGQVQRKPSTDSAPKSSVLGGEATADLVEHAVSGPGRPLDPSIRSAWERRLGHDLSVVRIHSDESADLSARRLGAAAFAIGDDVVFQKGRFAPATPHGDWLLGHELTHVIQQSKARPGSPAGIRIGTSESAAEREADTIAGMAGPSVLSGPVLRPQERLAESAVQMAKETRCGATGQILTIQESAGFGILAQKFIEYDYLRKTGATVGQQVYFDDSFAGRMDLDYINFIVSHNRGRSPQLGIALALRALNGSMPRPDILLDTGGRREYEEIKPDSPSGRAAGREKTASVGGYMREFALPYRGGSLYRPTKSMDLFSFEVLGVLVEASIGVRRESRGLIVYAICITTDFSKLAALAVLALVAQKVVELLRGAADALGKSIPPFPSLAPVSQPAPAMRTELPPGTVEASTANAAMQGIEALPLEEAGGAEAVDVLIVEPLFLPAL